MYRIAEFSQTTILLLSKALWYSTEGYYVDISSDFKFICQVELLDGLAKLNNAAVVLSVVLALGLTNFLVSQAKKLMENLRQIDVLLEFGLCDHHGKATLEWMYNNLDAAYKIMVN